MNDDRRLRRGILLFEQQNFVQAENEFRQALLEDPNNPVAHGFLALCLNEQEAFEDATREAQLAIQSGPDLGFPHYVLARVMQDRQRVEEAVAAIQVALRIDPHDTTFLTVYGTLLLNQRRLEEALEIANRGLAIDPQDSGCGNVRAAALVRLGRHEEADATIDGMLEEAPNDPYAHANLGWSLLHQGDHRQAGQHFREALRLDPNLEWARAGLLECLKARNFLYRGVLRFFLWMSKLSKNGQWGVLIGLWLTFQVVRRVADAQPDWAPYLEPLIYIYIAFAVFTWIATPLFNLLLRVDPFGKLVLSEEERRASTVFGVAFAAALILLAIALLQGGLWIGLALVMGLLLMPISGVFHCDAGWPRGLMLLYTAGLAVLGVVGALFVPPLLFAFLIGCVLSSFVGNLLSQATPTK